MRLGKGNKQGDSWGVAAQQRRTREGATNAESRDASGSERRHGDQPEPEWDHPSPEPNGLRLRNLRRLAAAEDGSDYSCVHRCALHVITCTPRARILGSFTHFRDVFPPWNDPMGISAPVIVRFFLFFADFVQIWTVTDSLHPSKGDLGFQEGGGFHGNR